MIPMKALAVLAASGLALAHPACAADKVLRVAPITDVQMLDPLFGSAWVNVVAGEMLYETLFMTGPVMVLPSTNPAVDMGCARTNLWGWPCDGGVEKRRTAFIYADEAARPAAMEPLQRGLLDAAP